MPLNLSLRRPSGEEGTDGAKPPPEEPGSAVSPRGKMGWSFASQELFGKKKASRESKKHSIFSLAEDKLKAMHSEGVYVPSCAQEIRYVFWGRPSTELPEQYYRKVDLPGLVLLALTECGKAKANVGIRTLVRKRAFCSFLTDAYWLVFLTILAPLNHAELLQAFLEAERVKQAKERSTPFSMSSQDKGAPSTPQAAAAPGCPAFLPDIPTTPRHLTGAASPFVRSPRRSDDAGGGGGGSEADAQSPSPSPPASPTPTSPTSRAATATLTLPPVSGRGPPPHTAEAIEQEVVILFGRMSESYHKLFWGIKQGIRQKDLLLKDLPEVIAFTLRRVFVMTLPYAKATVCSSVFAEKLVREASYWVTGVERVHVPKPPTGASGLPVRVPATDKKKRNHFHTSALVSLFAKGFSDPSNASVVARATRRSRDAREPQSPVLDPEERAAAKEDRENAERLLCYLQEEGLRQELSAMKKQFQLIAKGGGGGIRRGSSGAGSGHDWDGPLLPAVPATGEAPQQATAPAAAAPASASAAAAAAAVAAAAEMSALGATPNPFRKREHLLPWYEKGKHNGQRMAPVSTATHSFVLTQRSPLMQRFASDQGLGRVKPEYIERSMIWLKPRLAADGDPPLVLPQHLRQRKAPPLSASALVHAKHAGAATPGLTPKPPLTSSPSKDAGGGGGSVVAAAADGPVASSSAAQLQQQPPAQPPGLRAPRPPPGSASERRALVTPVAS